MEHDWRELSQWEYALLQKMLTLDFPGSHIYKNQAKRALVRNVDDGYLEFLVPEEMEVAKGAQFKHFALVETPFRDADGVPASFILHERNGRLWMLERYKADSSELLLQMPPLDDLSVRLI